MVRRFANAALACLPLSATGQSNPAGLWRCVMNSVAVSIDVQYQIAPDRSLVGQGTVVFSGTSAIYQVQGAGRWSAGGSPETGRFTYAFQLLPPNHASFTLFTEPTGDPNAYYQLRQNLSQGGQAETACQRFG